MSLLLILLAACSEPETNYEGAFDTPGAVAVLEPETGGPFDVPVGYVAERSRIALLDLAEGRFLADQEAVSFARGAPLPFGAERSVSSVSPWAPSEGTVHVFAADQAFDVLVRVPHIVGVSGGVPQRPALDASDPVFVDADGSGDSPQLVDLSFNRASTSTETWTLTFDGQRWVVRGSRSGRLEDALPGEPYVGDRRAIAFTVQGGATAGDSFEITTDSGLVEYDAGGTPIEVATSPDQSRVAVTVDAGDDALLRFFDPEAETFEDVSLPEGAAPVGLAWAGERLFAADRGLPVVWEIGADGAVVQHDLPFPTDDVAPLLGDEELVYVARADAEEVWILDLGTGSLRDVNPWADGVQGMSFRVPVGGIAPIATPYLWPQLTDEGGDIRGRSVAVSLASGEVVFMADETGCLVRDETGPTTAFISSFGSSDFVTNFDRITNGPFLQQNATNSRHAVVNPCAGVAPPETWSLTYHEDVQAWVVEGSVSGEQVGLAFEDERYVSDGGEVSFLIRNAGIPSVDGWTIEFQVLGGYVTADGDNDGFSGQEVDIALPGDPVAYTVEQDGEVVPFVLVASRGSDLALRIDPTDGVIDVEWW